jgi:integrase/recombinase XerD
VQRVSKKDIRDYLVLMAEKGRAGSSINVCLQALKFYFEQVMYRRKMYIDIMFSKRPSKIPCFLDKEEIDWIIKNIKNHKHKLMIVLMYSAGLRVGELVNLKAGDLNLKQRYGFVRKGKGDKDRIFIISEKLVSILCQFIVNNNLDYEDFLFISSRGSKYNIRTIQSIIKKACKKAGITGKKVSPHTFRHSFATHLIEQGQSVSEVQSLLGHKSPETTFIYLHTSKNNLINIKSPLDCH